MYQYDIVNDMMESPSFKQLTMDNEFAGELYAALCNMRWYKIPEDESDEVVLRLSKAAPSDFTDDDCMSCSWRGAGGVVADLRNPGLRKTSENLEDYMDWYCNGKEGCVTDRIRDTLAAIAWHPIDWPGRDL